MVEDIGKKLNFTSLRYHRLDDMIQSVGIDPVQVVHLLLGRPRVNNILAYKKRRADFPFSSFVYGSFQCFNCGR